MPLKALKSMGAKHHKSPGTMERYWDQGKDSAEKKGLTGQSKWKYTMAIARNRAAGSGSEKPKSESEQRLMRRIDERLGLVEMDVIKFKGETYKVGTATGGGSVQGDKPGVVNDRPTSRPLYGAGGKHVGQINGDQSIEIYGASAGEAGESGVEDPEKKKKIHPPKAVGFDVSWENPRAAAGITLTGQPSIGSGRTGKFFPFDDASDQMCVGCGGKGYLPSDIEGDKPKPCPTCHGIGKRNHRVEQFAKAMRGQGFKVNIRPARGKMVRQYPQAGKITPDAQVGL